MCKRNILTIVAVVILALATGQVQAVTVTVPNGDFETLYKPGTLITGVVSSGGWTQGVGPDCPIDNGTYEFDDGTTGDTADIPGWIGYDRQGWIDNGGTYGRDETTGNLQGSISRQDPMTGLHIYLANGGGWGNPAGGLIVSDASLGNILNRSTYTLSMYAKGGATPVVLELLADGVALTPSSSVDPVLSGEWQEFSRTYDAASLTSYVGQTMTIVLGVGRGATGNQSKFDEVSLSYELLTLARNPRPAEEATDVPRDEVVLSWTPGMYADTHDVYLGTVFDDVNDADRTNPLGVLVSEGQSAASYDPGRLDFGQTYYWRIDEVNAPPDSTIFKGYVWSFTVEPFALQLPSESIIAVTASSQTENQGPENTVNGSGLDNDLHSNDITAMWITAAGETGPAWIQYEFDQVYKLGEMWVWNHNGMLEPAIGFGIKEVTIEYSVNGTDYTTLGATHEFARGTGAAGYAHNTTVDLEGVAAKYVKLTPTSNWGGILEQYGLSEVRFFSIPVFAREPSPESGATGVDVETTLSWRVGRDAAKHDVYLSTDEQAVIDGNVPVATVTENSYSTSLDLESTYYWRIDEVNDAETPTTWKGEIWNLTTPESLLVEDFERYNDLDNRIFNTWIDGPENIVYYWHVNCSIVGYADPPFTEQSIVHGGSQSMPFFYNNDKPYDYTYSEASLTLSPAQDWTKYGIKALTLWFFGDPTNDAEQMYVRLNGYRVSYDGDAENLKRRTWQMWYIDLASFGVDLSNVRELSIGFGDGKKIPSGVTGLVFFDDIRLYSRDREMITPVDPGADGLQLHYELEGTFNDSSVNARHGTAVGDPVFVAGKIGQAISLDGVDDYVNIDGYKGICIDPNDPNRVQPAFSIAQWFKTSGNGEMVTWGTSAGRQRLSWRINGGRLRTEHAAGNLRGNTYVNDGEWHHGALVVTEGANLRVPNTLLYIDGQEDSTFSGSDNPYELTAGADVCIGCRADNKSRFFPGSIDDVRIYDRALTLEEVAWLGGRTIPFDKPF